MSRSGCSASAWVSVTLQVKVKLCWVDDVAVDDGAGFAVGLPVEESVARMIKDKLQVTVAAGHSPHVVALSDNHEGNLGIDIQ